MAAIFGGDNGESGKVQLGTYADFDVRVRVARIGEQFRENLMTLVDGNLSEYETAKKLTANEYLTKLEHKVKQDKMKQHGR